MIFLFFVIGFSLILFAVINLKRDYEQVLRASEMLIEAKLVQKNLLQLLQETKQTSDILVENVEEARDISQKLSICLDKHENIINSKITVVDSVSLPHNKVVSEDDNIISLRRSRVKQLYDNGMGIEEIAKSLSMGKGEVQLILNLIRKEVEVSQ